jgi:uncharacterized protein
MEAGGELPRFRYHPDPLATGCVKPAKRKCACCGRARGYIYIGPVPEAKELSERVCPWCIADGSAAAKFDAEFTDPGAVGDYGAWPAVPAAVAEEVSRRTPGFWTAGDGVWWTHCGDAAEFLGTVKKQGALRAGPDYLAELRGEQNDAEWREFLESLDKPVGPWAYLFRCRHCGRYGGYRDWP